MIHNSLSKTLDKQIARKIVKLSKNKYGEEDNRIEDICKSEKITKEQFFEEVQDKFNKTVIEACRFYKIKFNDRNISNFIRESSHKHYQWENENLIDSQIRDIIHHTIQNHMWKPMTNEEIDQMCNRKPRTSREWNAEKGVWEEWSEVMWSAGGLKRLFQQTAKEMYYLQKDIKNRLIDVEKITELPW